MSQPADPWYRINNPDTVNSPSLLIYPERIEINIERMISMVRDKSLLRPHVKTHKMPGVVKIQISHGITKFKCATIAEAEMTAACGPEDVLIAYQPVGPNIPRFISLQKKFPGILFSCLVDCSTSARKIADKAVKENTVIDIWIDINNGMNRTGITPGSDAIKLFHLIHTMPGLKFRGFHVYDGHIHDKDFSERKTRSDKAYESVEEMIAILKESGKEIKVIAGGTPTFPVHAQRKGVETSPGTSVLWDYGYSSSFSDLEFLHAAVLLTRVVSKPADEILCIDLGTKAVASEMPHPRVKFPELDNYGFIAHNEEHMVIRTADAGKFRPGDLIYCLPWHICPTSDRYDKVYVVNNGIVTEEWEVSARKRKITI